MAYSDILGYSKAEDVPAQLQCAKTGLWGVKQSDNGASPPITVVPNCRLVGPMRLQRHCRLVQ